MLMLVSLDASACENDHISHGSSVRVGLANVQRSRKGKQPRTGLLEGSVNVTRSAASDRSEEPQTRVEIDAGGGGGEQPAKRRPLLLSLLPEVALLGASIFLFILASNFDYAPVPGQLGPGFWPKILCAGIGVCAAVRLGQKLLVPEQPVARAVDEEGEAEVRLPRVALAVVLVIGYVLGTIFLGYVLSTALFLSVFIYLGGQRKWYVIPIGVLGSLVFTYVFLKVVYVSVPSGVGVFDQLSAALYRILGIY